MIVFWDGMKLSWKLALGNQIRHNGFLEHSCRIVIPTGTLIELSPNKVMALAKILMVFKITSVQEYGWLK